MMNAQPNTQANAQPAPAQKSPQEVFELAKHRLAMGDIHEALLHASLLRGHFPDQTPILAIHGIATAALGAYGIAIPDLERAADETAQALETGDPENPARPRIADQLLRTLAELSACYLAVGKPEKANAALDRAEQVDPEAPEVVRGRVAALCAAGELDKARALLKEADDAGLEELPSALASAQIALSDPNASEEACRLLAERLRAITDRGGLDASTQARVLRDAGRLFDRAGDPDECFRAHGRAANFTRGQYDPAVNARLTDAIIAAWTADKMGKVQRPDADHSKRIFVIGAPHSGADELARAMAQDDRVGNAGPLEALTVASQKAGAQRTPYRPAVPNPDKLRRDQLSSVASIYTKLSDQASYPQNTDYVIDTCVLQNLLLGLAALALPGASFVFVRRDPAANLLDAYFKGVPGHHPYTKELPTLAAYLRDIDRIITHWSSVFESMGVRVEHTTREALADNPAGETERIMQAIGIENPQTKGPRFEPAPADHADRYARRIDPIRSLLPTPVA